MGIRDTSETRAVTLVDIPVVMRLSEGGVVLNSEVCFTQDASNSPSNLFTLLWPIRGMHTLVTRSEKRHVVGQFQVYHDAPCAHVAYIAPALDEGEDDTEWLHVLDAMAVEAGRRGAHMLSAEVDENAPLFKTMRQASYAIYARQEIWRRDPEDSVAAAAVELSAPVDSDLMGIHALFGNIVPRLMHPITDLPDVGEGLVYRKQERVEGYIGVTEGKAGVYLTPHLHPDVFSDAPAVLTAAIQRIERCQKVPVYVRVRRYQDWLDDALEDLGFHIHARQAVMVKHITAGVRSAAFAPLRHTLETVPNTVKPPRSGVTDLVTRHKRQE
jgi:hypothetical protein